MLLSIFYYVLIIHIKFKKNITSNFLLYTINTYKKIKLNKYKYDRIQVKQIQISFYHVSVVSQFGFWRQLSGGCQCRKILHFTQAQAQCDPVQGFSIYGHFSLCSSLRTAFW